MLDAEFIHDQMTYFGELLENFPGIIEWFFAFRDRRLNKTVAGIQFENPIGLSAGFDYDGHMAKVMKSVGFGFNTVGTVIYSAYDGNEKPRLVRLPKSKSLFVNKGFKSEGAKAVARRLDKKNLKNQVLRISIGDREGNIDNITKTFQVFKEKNYVKYFELNISCPNIPGQINFDKLVKAVGKLKITQPIFVKMPNEISFKDSDKLVTIAIKSGISGFIFSNLVKDRNNPALDKTEITKFKDLKGNFSGKPTFKNSNKLIKHTRQKFGKKIVIIGTGGIFNANDAKEKFKAGADLVQLITGMIYEGPQLIGEICREL